jgi:hypothetical protein
MVVAIDSVPPVFQASDHCQMQSGLAALNSPRPLTVDPFGDVHSGDSGDINNTSI